MCDCGDPNCPDYRASQRRVGRGEERRKAFEVLGCDETVRPARPRALPARRQPLGLLPPHFSFRTPAGLASLLGRGRKDRVGIGRTVRITGYRWDGRPISSGYNHLLLETGILFLCRFEPGLARSLGFMMDG